MEDKKRRKKVGIVEVAKEANVSTATVSHVLNRTRVVSSDLVRAVMEAVEEVGYTQRTSKETLTIAMLGSDMAAFFPVVLEGLEEVAWTAGYHVIVCNTGDDLPRQEDYLRRLLAKRVDGYIVAPVSQPSPLLRQMSARGVPMVIYDREVPYLQREPMVVLNNQSAAQEAVEHLIADGHTRIGIITGKENPTAQGRRDGYRRALEARGLWNDTPAAAELMQTCESTPEGGKAAAAALLRLPSPPEAIFATDNQMTAGALQCLRENEDWGPWEPGKKQTALIGFDEHVWLSLLRPMLTVVDQPAKEMGQRAGQLLLSRLRGTPVGNTKVILEAHLVVRGSCSRKCAIREVRNPGSPLPERAHGVD